MSNFPGINNFGSLTASNGTRLTFKDFDLDGDNKVTKEEYEQVLKDNNIDKVELTSIDKDGNLELSEEEFAVYEQKNKMQDTVNDYVKKQKDFLGDKAKYLPELSAGLKDLINTYAENFTGAVSEMANMFEKELPEKYNELKSTVLANDPATIKSEVLEEIAVSLTTATRTLEDGSNTKINSNAQKTIMATLQAEANTFVKNYTGDNLKADLKVYLEEVLNKSDMEKLGDAINKYEAGKKSLGVYIDDTEFESLKEYAKELLQTALDKGIEVKLGAQKVSATNIDAVINKYKTAEELDAAINEFVYSGLSTVNKLDQVVADEESKAQEAAEKAFTSIPGSAYKVDINSLNLPQDYYENKTKSKKGKGQDYYKTEARETLDAIKAQIKEQITATLEAKGVPFEKIEQVFENIYTMTSEEAINEAVSGRHGTWFRKSKSSYNVKDLVDKFIEKFNTKIEEEVNNMNKSDKDMDLQDIDYSVSAKDKDGKVNENMLKLLQQGGTTRVSNNKANETIENMISALKPQLLAKAKIMCKANGIEFDPKTFEQKFNSTSQATIASSNDDIKIVFGGGIMARPIERLTILNPQQITKDFVTNFNTNYTAWVDSEKAKLANK